MPSKKSISRTSAGTIKKNNKKLSKKSKNFKKSFKVRSAILREEDLALALPGFAKYFFVAVILVVMALFFWVISPFFNVLVYAALIAVVFYPLHKLFLKFFHGHKSIAAILSTSLVVLICLAPLALFTVFIAQEAIDTYEILEVKISEMDVEAIDGVNDLPWIGDTLDVWAKQYGFKEFVREADIDVFGLVQSVGESVSSFIFNNTTSMVKSLGDIVINLFILLLTLFFFFRDGESVSAMLKKMSPLPMKYENEIEKKLKATTYGIVVGNFGTAVLQGLVGAIGFWIAGVDNVVFWGTIMAFASLIPYIGASIIWAPFAVIFLIQGEVTWASFLVMWGVFAVATVDNIARPLLVGGSTKMHPLATFLVILGGIFIFGLKGIIFGPLILSLAVTIIHIYELEYKELLKS